MTSLFPLAEAVFFFFFFVALPLREEVVDFGLLPDVAAFFDALDEDDEQLPWLLAKLRAAGAARGIRDP